VRACGHTRTDTPRKDQAMPREIKQSSTKPASTRGGKDQRAHAQERRQRRAARRGYL